MDYTADLCVGGTATASSEAGANYVAAKAFDDSMATPHAVAFNVHSYWIKYDFGVDNAKTISQYTVVSKNKPCPNNWTFEGSNDDSDWDVLDTQTSQAAILGTKQTYNFTNTTAYRYYRLNISYGGTPNNYSYIDEIEMMEAIVDEYTEDVYTIGEISTIISDNKTNVDSASTIGIIESSAIEVGKFYENSLLIFANAVTSVEILSAYEKLATLLNLNSSLLDNSISLDNVLSTSLLSCLLQDRAIVQDNLGSVFIVITSSEDNKISFEVPSSVFTSSSSLADFLEQLENLLSELSINTSLADIKILATVGDIIITVTLIQNVISVAVDRPVFTIGVE